MKYPWKFTFYPSPTLSIPAHDHLIFPSRVHPGPHRQLQGDYQNAGLVKNDQCANLHCAHKHCGNNPKMYRSLHRDIVSELRLSIPVHKCFKGGAHFRPKQCIIHPALRFINIQFGRHYIKIAG